MIMGFPGSTQRYMTSYEIDDMLNVSNPNRIFIRGERQAILKEDMAASDKVRIQYASKYATSSNYWKNSIGKSRGIRRLDVKGRKQEQEAAFTAWAAKNTLPTEGYSNALNLIRESVEETAPYFASSQYLSEAIGRSVEILAPARLAVSKKGGELTEALKAFYKDYNMPTDRRVAKRMFRIVGENCKELPSVFAEVIGKRFGGDTDAYVDYLYDNSVFADERKALAAAAAGTDVSNDPAVLLNKSYTAKMRELADKKLAITLALSLHASNQKKRLELMPVANKYDIHEVIDACRYYFEQTGRRVTFEYSLVGGVNDTKEDAKELTELIHGMNCHVNLIPVNPIRERDYVQSNAHVIEAFKEKLERSGLTVTVRREMGRDIDGACGQLRRKYKENQRLA